MGDKTRHSWAEDWERKMLGLADHCEDLCEMGRYRWALSGGMAWRDLHFNRTMLTSENSLQRLRAAFRELLQYCR